MPGPMLSRQPQCALFNYSRDEALLPLWAKLSEYLKFMGEAKEWLFKAPSLEASDRAFKSGGGIPIFQNFPSLVKHACF